LISRNALKVLTSIVAVLIFTFAAGHSLYFLAAIALLVFFWGLFSR